MLREDYTYSDETNVTGGEYSSSVVKATLAKTFVNSHQKTIKNAITCRGIGLHSGNHVEMTIKPAAENTGITFRRTDVASSIADVKAVWSNVSDAKLCTCIENDDGVQVHTIEHIMAAFSGFGITNAVVELDNDEVAILDGSAEGFVKLIEDAGIKEQAAPNFAIKILKPIEVKNGESIVRFEPLQEGDAKGFHMTVDIDFSNTVIGKQSCSIVLNSDDFKRDICQARTFGFLNEVNYLKSQNLIQGGSEQNAIIVDEDGIINEEGLRCEDEFAKHKMLDAIGDLALAGLQIEGKFYGYRSGHYLNNLLLQKLSEERDTWCLVPVSESSNVQNISEEIRLSANKDISATAVLCALSPMIMSSNAR